MKENEAAPVNRRSCFGMIAACFLSLQVAQGCEHSAKKVAIGREAPNFTYRDLEGKTRNLIESRGNVVVLRFWADWCAPCTAEFPVIEKTYQEMRGKGLDIIAVNVRQPEARVKDYVRKFDLSHTIALDRDGKISERYGVKSLPMNFIIDRDGVLKEVIIGAISDAAMLKQFVTPYF
jgi:cytochrome c biogenesis protein CcmG, thiol:disulfide interchange protein DsbE